MITGLVKKIFGSRNDRVIKKLNKTVAQVNSVEEEFKSLNDSDFPEKTKQFKERIQQGESLDNILPEAFALVREAGLRVLNMRHFDVQLIGAMVLHNGNIAEMRTGEGKTLVATLAAYLNALSGSGVHVITVNDYLAKRDSEWMGQIYNFLGLTTGVIVSGLSIEERKAAYQCDITYGTNNEFGFDYLRDNMAFSNEGRVQRGLNFAIVDEVDSILIDEARTPLVISGMVDDKSDLYITINALIPKLVVQKIEDGPGDFTLDEKSKQAYFTEDGHDHIEQLLREQNVLKEDQALYDPVNISILHHLNAALRAHHLFNKDVDYIVKDDEIVIVDEFTGRTMQGRRWSEGLHQAIEAKEGVTIQNENQTLASITYQNYFRLYSKLSGMTGTADTEAFEFQSIYGLEVVIIPTNMSMIRDDQSDIIFLTAKEKYAAMIEDIKDCQSKGQPVLVGTASIEVSEYLSNLLNKENIKHQVLNAKFHEREAEIIAQAGQTGAITIATNMAGRGTDIVLGGNYESEIKSLNEPDQKQVDKINEEWKQRHQQVLDSGGLHIIGTERHESRRIDNQLRGRSGRQGDPGSSRFYLSLEDNLMRIFASDRISSIMQKLGMDEGEAIESKLVTRAIENAQRKVEAHNFDIRKHLLEYDDVANDQRKVIYEQRNELLDEEDVSEQVNDIRSEVIEGVIDNYIPRGSMEEMWDISGLTDAFQHEFDLVVDIDSWLKQDKSLHEEALREKIHAAMEKVVKDKEEMITSELMRRVEKQIMLDVLDRHWKEHLVNMDHLRQGIQLRSFAGKNPKQEYKREAFELFVQMLEAMKHDVVVFLSRVNIRTEQDVELAENQEHEQNMNFNHASAPSSLNPGVPEQASPPAEKPYTRSKPKVGRNEPCPCGSGKKFKQCHGRLS
ncbi:MAG: preprotein translocase subunit SecA [Proteobacteria bacterium]|nr:preprotein translocase subunit SecA [Pseudomonadota bacterium]NOG60100.1 preprotein translocase subunit SecA [Pseudomonadota bacterium]